ncbi:MAG TPA: putative Ig domain-containing protein [Candidatus Acidoferrum sp.]|nr:putative Ig domain-containing protein [Candidatus Acidoferrum sp.]
MRMLRWVPAFTLLFCTIGSPRAVLGQTSGPSVNMVSGTGWTNGDPFLQRQNEPSLAVSTRNTLHLFGGANDYRSVDIAGLGGQSERADAWLGVFKSFDGGQTWQSTLLPGFPLDSSPAGMSSPLHGFQAAADPTVRAGTNGLFYYSGIAFNRGAGGLGTVFVARFIDNDNKENGDATHTNGTLTNLAPTDPIQYLGVATIDSGTSGQFLDKPWMATDVPRGTTMCAVPFTKPDGTQGTQTIPAGNVYLTYTSFNGNQLTNSQDTKIMFASSQDCGATWTKATKLSESNSINQGTIVVVDPSSANNAAATIYVAWRRFASSSQPDAMMIAKSTNGGNTFSKAVQAVTFPTACSTTTPASTGCAFDQGTTAASFRTSAFPALTVDDTGRVYLAWSQRQASGDARIMMQVSPDGLNWSSAPALVDNGPVLDDSGNPFSNLSGHGHQLMPSLNFSAGKLSLVYFDFRQDHTLAVFAEKPDLSGYIESRQFEGELVGDPASTFVFNSFVSDAAPPLTTRRHTIDVQGAQASPLSPGALGVPGFAAFRISRYLFGINPFDDPSQAEQLQVDAPDLPMFEQGTVPFFGDYIDIAAAPPFLLQGGKWVFNTNSSNFPVFHAVWTDNRDVVPPSDGNWMHYVPPFSASNPAGSVNTSIFDPTQTVTACQVGVNDGFVASRNQNIYTSTVAPGLVVGSQGNFKPLGFQPNTNPPQLLQRAFTLTLQNTTTATRSFRISIGNQPALPNGQPDPQGQASLLQFSLQTSLDVTIGAQSSIARAVFIQSANPTASVTVNAQEITAPNGSLVPGGLTGFVVFNPDPNAPQILDPDNFGFANPAILSAESHNPAIGNPAIGNPAIGNPAIINPAIGNPAIGNPAIGNPAIGNPSVAVSLNPAIGNPAIGNPAIGNPAIGNPAIGNQSVTDATYQVTNVGNTTTSYAVKLFQKSPLPAGVNLQLILTKQYLLPQAQGCNLLQQIQNVIVANVPNPVFTPAGNLGDPDLPDPAVTNATLALEPGQNGQLVIRANVSDPNVMQDILANTFTPVVVAHPSNTGFATPPATLAILSSSLPDAVTGMPYAGQVTLFGGLAPYTVSVTNGSLPTGLSITNTGLITGTPGAAGSFTFTIQVTDSAAQQSITTQVLTIRVGSPLVIGTTTLPAATISVPYSASLNATGGFGNVTWSLTSGVLPTGLSLSSAGGVISGTTSATGGTFTFTVQATDSSCLISVSNCQPQIATLTLSIVIDSTPPVITPTINGTLGLNGWYVSNVTVTGSAVDPESGIASSAGCGSTFIATDSPGFSVTCSATNGAGLSSINTVTIKRDTTPPSIIGTRTPAPNAAGWNNTNVTVTFTCTDNLSGVAPGYPAGGTALTANTPASGATVSGTCIDLAGNASATNVGPVKIDKTSPSITISAPANGATYMLNALVASNFTCSDALSGIASCVGPVASGANFNTSSGPHTFTVIATDVAGNQTQATSNYNVGYNFVGFLSPLATAGTVSAPSFSGTVNQGSAVPLKWELLDSSGNAISNLSSVTSIVACPSTSKTAPPGAPCVLLYSPTVGAKGNSTFRFSNPQFIFNWDTSSTIGVVAGYFTVEVQLSDGSPAKATTVQFK